MIRVRITFNKTEEMRFTGHLDLYRAWERAFRRAKLPLSYSQGFKPHPRINIAAALPLGFTSSNDIVDVWFEEDLSEEEIISKLEASLPPGIRLLNVKIIPPNEPPLQKTIIASQYLITLLNPVSDLNHRIEQLLAQSHISWKKKDKTIDLRPLIFELALIPDNAHSKQTMHILLSSSPNANARPDDVIEALGLNPETTLFHRQKLFFQNDHLYLQIDKESKDTTTA